MDILFESRTSNLGDQLCIMRVIKEFADASPDCEIGLAGLPFTSLYENADFITKVCRAAPVNFLKPAYERSARASAKRVVVFDLSPREIFKKFTSEGKHLIEAYAAQVPIEIKRIEPFAAFDAGPFLHEAERLLERPAIAIAPNSPSCLSRVNPGQPPNKEWPRRNWADLLQRIPDKYHLYDFGARNEQKLDGPERLRHIYGKDLRLAACMIGLCDIFIGLDNGLAHLARAVGQNNIVQIYGDHAPVSWAAYPENHVINGTRISDISVDKAWETIKGLV